MKPEQRLEELVVKYHINSRNDRYSCYLYAKKLLEKLVRGVKKIILVADEIKDASMVKNLLTGECEKLRCKSQDIGKMKQSTFACDMILAVDFIIRPELRTALGRLVENSSIQLIFMYDYFASEGLLCKGEFYDVLQGKRVDIYEGKEVKNFMAQEYYEAIYRDKKRYMAAMTRPEREKCLQKLIFDYVFIKDFVYAEKYINKYIEQRYESYKEYENFMVELKLLFREMKEITLISKQHIIIFWLDALGKGEENGMPFFNSLEEKGLVFDNAFTASGTTSMTMKAIFLKKRIYEDSAYEIMYIKKEESPLLRYLSENGYQFSYYGFIERFEEKLYGKNAILGTPCSMLHWEVLCDMCESEQKKCYLVHDFAETHVLYTNGVMEDFLWMYYGQKGIGIEERYLQRELGKYYLDLQLKFCEEFISEENKQIFMSDHAGWSEERLRGNGSHVNLIVMGKQIKKDRVQKMFSYVDFDMLVKYICEGDEKILEKVLKDYVIVEFLDIYSKLLVENAIRGKNVSLSSFGWRACVTQEDEYFLYSVGKEEYNVFPSLVNRVHLPECAERVQYLRQLTGDEFVDVDNIPFFQYSKLLHQIWNHYVQRTGGKEKGVKLLQKVISQIPEEKVIAIRGGGKHTIAILEALEKEAVKIKYVIDQNPVQNVMIKGPGLHFELITPEEMGKRKIDVVILSSLRYRKEMKEELLRLKKCQIIDVYSMLEVDGTFLDKGFYEINLLEEDYNSIKDI